MVKKKMKIIVKTFRLTRVNSSPNKNSSFKKSLLANVRTVQDEFQKAEEVI